MHVGVIELLIDEAPSRNWLDRTYWAVFKKQYASIMPQAVAVWCRQLGHHVSYATYYGQQDPLRLLPDDLDVLFVSTHTQASALSYALARLYRRQKTLTVIGGPHARSFPRDCLRFFDLVVGHCDRALIADIVRGSYDPGAVVSSERPLMDLPGVEERLPEIRSSIFVRGRPAPSSTVPLLASIGCPYHCDFCIDWSTPYVTLPRERIEADLHYLSTHWPGVMVSYHDPNFAVRFDEMMAVMETVPARTRNPYIMESSLSVLKGSRLRRLKDTNCIYIASGIESWTGYSAKAGVGHAAGAPKLAALLDQFHKLHRHGFALQANFIVGMDGDRGSEPVDLTAEFIRRLPFVWPVVNVPIPFGGTPLFDACLANDRLLRAMPFSFYYTPYLVTTLEHYAPIDYCRGLSAIYALLTSGGMLARRLATRATWGIRSLHALRTVGMRQDLAAFHQFGTMLETDDRFRAFHEGRKVPLPEFYHSSYERRLGRYAELLSRADRTPEFDPMPHADSSATLVASGDA
jgi:radical SAM superfamily enzyme YgiQ (UPF0313 family)